MEECKRLAQLTHEIPVDQTDFEYCPACPGKVVLEFIEKPPSVSCPKCGLARDEIDITSAAVHDKETPVHIPFTYRPKQHFEAWINRVTGKTRYVIPKDILAEIFIEINNMRIFDLDAVTWDVIDRILRKLAKKVHPRFNQYYQHVYQITNIIRGQPILSLSSAQKQDLLDMFDVIYESWERNKDPNRSNFMSNGFVLQMCFSILGYPEQAIGMFNMLKGPGNLKDYDRICKLICEENEWNWEKVQSSVLANAKYMGEHNILDLIPVDNDDDDDNPFLDKPEPSVTNTKLPPTVFKPPVLIIPKPLTQPTVKPLAQPVKPPVQPAVKPVVKPQSAQPTIILPKPTATLKLPSVVPITGQKRPLETLKKPVVVKGETKKTARGFKMGKFLPPPQRSIFEVLQQQ
jgi:hypothetical protein